MRTLLSILLLIPGFCIAQQNDVFIKLTNTSGQQIKGEAVLKGFENWLGATTISGAGKNNTQLAFTMTVNGASADLKKAMANGELLLTGQVSVLATNQSLGRPTISYTIKMEKITVLTCYEVMGCNNSMNTTVTLQAARTGWTYYNQTRSGTPSVSKRFGWDAENNKEWTSF
jgi:type VI protein secretion system component Hcp